jgi:DNA repair photolyase
VAVANPFGLITRGPMVLRDVDVLLEGSRHAEVKVNVSIPTLDGRVWRTTEPGTARPERRMDVVGRLASAGLDVSVAMAPILPGLSDAPEQLEAVVRAARAAGAHGIWANLVYLRPGTREHFLEALARDWPDQLARYQHLYAERAYLPRSETEPVREHVRALARDLGVGRDERRRAPAQPRPAQLTLAV